MSPGTAVVWSTFLDCTSSGEPGGGKMSVLAHDCAASSVHGFSTSGGPTPGGGVTAKRSTRVEPSVPALTVAVTVRVSVVPTATVPTVQSPLVESKVPVDGVAETNVTPAGSVSVAVTPVASAVPVLPTVMV